MILKPEQERVINHDIGDLLVSASAGSGKTFATIKRITRLIIEGKATVEQILAVTFTEKAALDMKEKLIKALIKEINDGKTCLMEQLERAKTADISTLHSFCARLLRSYFFFAELPADFEVLDEVEAGKIKAEVIDKLFDELYENGDESFACLVKRHSSKRRDGELKKLVINLNSYAKNEADSVAFLNTAIDCVTEERFKKYFEEVTKAICFKLNSLRFDAELSLKTFILADRKDFVDYINAFLERIELHLTQSVYEIVKNPFKRTKPNKPKDAEGLKANAIIEKVKKDYEKILESVGFLTDYDTDLNAFLSTKPHARSLVKLVLEFDRRYTEEKKDSGKVDFSDLEHLTLKLLENDDFARDIREKYKFIFVDEYQDTNGVQEAILLRISNNNLFMVGDLKQSIYGFRGCNPLIFAQKLVDYPEENKASLNYNYRSSTAVVDTVNQVFSKSMTQEFSGVDYANTCPLQEGGRYPKGCGKSELHFVSEPKTETVYQKGVYNLLEDSSNTVTERSAEGKLIVSIIQRELGSTYYDPDDECEKELNYGDICILVRGRNAHVEGIIDELNRANIPFSADNVVEILKFPEIMALVDLVKTLDNMQNEIPFVSVLKNFYAVTDFELAKIRKAQLKGSFLSAIDSYLHCGDELSEKLISAKESLSHYRKLAKVLPAFDLLRKIIADTDFELKCLALSRGKEKKDRIQRFLAESRFSGKALNIREFLDRISNSKNSFKMEASGGEDAVKIMTMHGSKGLEFPMVIVANVFGEFNKQDLSGVVIEDRDCCFALHAYDDFRMNKKETMQRAYLKNKKHRQLLQEEMRLYYVALTRAKYSLFITGSAKNELPQKNSLIFANCYADFTPLAFVENDYYSLFNNESVYEDLKKVSVGESDKEITNIIREYLSFNYPDIEATTLPLKTSVTASLSHEQEEYKVMVVGGETTAEKGVIAHKILEFFDFSKTTDRQTVLAEIERLRSLDIVTQNELDEINLDYLVATLTSEHFNLDGYKLYREKNFFVSCPANMLMDTKSDKEIVLQGVIDLLAVKGDTAIIIDYKYSSKNAENLRKTYAKQLQLYKYAVESSLKIKVEKTMLVSLKNAEFIELPS